MQDWLGLAEGKRTKTWENNEIEGWAGVVGNLKGRDKFAWRKVLWKMVAGGCKKWKLGRYRLQTGVWGLGSGAGGLGSCLRHGAVIHNKIGSTRTGSHLLLWQRQLVLYYTSRKALFSTIVLLDWHGRGT